MAWKTGWAPPGDPPMILRISVVAFCFSSASASRFDASASRWSASARRASRSRPVASSSLGDLRATGGLASLDLAGFGPRRIGLPLPPMNRPGTGYGERGRLGKGTANGTLSLPRVEWREGELVNNLGRAGPSPTTQPPSRAPERETLSTHPQENYSFRPWSLPTANSSGLLDSPEPSQPRRRREEARRIAAHLRSEGSSFP